MVRRLLGPIGVWAIFALLGLPACASKDDASVIRELVDKGVRLAEKHDIDGLLELAARDFAAYPGGLDRRETSRILWWAFRHYGQFKIVHPRPRVEMSADEASALARFPFLILRKEQSVPDLRELYEDPQCWLEEAGEVADLYRLEVEWVKRGGAWSVRRGRLEAFKGLGFGEAH